MNIWFFMQRLSLVKQNVNLKYGLGLELNNYRYKSSAVLSYREAGVIPYSNGIQTNAPFIFRDSISFSKNKLAADYLTVPMMLNINFTPKRKNGFGLSGGISAGYLYSARYKTKEGKDVEKVKSDFDLERFKLSYIGELSLGPVRLYGSYAMKNMWEKGLDMTPYTLGFR